MKMRGSPVRFLPKGVMIAGLNMLDGARIHAILRSFVALGREKITERNLEYIADGTHRTTKRKNRFYFCKYCHAPSIDSHESSDARRGPAARAGAGNGG